MIIRLGLLAFMMIASLSCTGCVSHRATTTLKSRQNTTCSVGAGKFRIEAFKYSHANRNGMPPKASEPVSITADELNQIAVKSYPSLFSDDRSGWPLSVNVMSSTKREYNYAFFSLLTLYIVPFPFEDTVQYRVAINISSVSPSVTNVTFSISEATWMAWPPLGLISIPGPSDARGTSLDSSALVNLTGESIVEAVAMQLTRLDASQIAKLTDQTWLDDVAIEGKNESVRMVAARKLTDQECLAKVAIEDKNESVRKVAARKINDHACLEKVVFDSTDYDIRATVVRKIHDQAVLSKLAISDHDLNIRAYAAGRITDQKLISQLAEDRDPIIRMAVVENIEDQALLQRISVNDSEATVRQQAMSRLAKLKRDNP